MIPSHILVALYIWLQPFPNYVYGNIVNYGNQYLVEVNAQYRNYDLSLYPNRCGVSLMSPSDLGKSVWIKLPSGIWIQCVSIDAGAWIDYYDLIYLKEEIVEVPNWVLKLFTDNCCITQGEIYIGLCPPENNLYPIKYNPKLELSNTYERPYFEWNKQQIPTKCDNFNDK